jgi:hypothetical protein
MHTIPRLLRVRLGAHTQATKGKGETGNACLSTRQHTPFYLHKSKLRSITGTLLESRPVGLGYFDRKQWREGRAGG